MTKTPPTDIDELVRQHRSAVTASRRSRTAALRAAADRRRVVAELRATGLTMPVIAELIGSTPGAVEQTLRRHRELAGKGRDRRTGTMSLSRITGTEGGAE